MTSKPAAVVVRADDRTTEIFADPSRGNASWFTFFSSDITPTDTMCAGLMELPARDRVLRPHRHAQPEIYHVVGGSGVVTIGAIEHRVSAGTAVFIPGNAEHSVLNNGEDVLRIFYVFPADRFSDVLYEFPPYEAEA